MKKKKIIIGSVIGLMLLVGTIGALNPTETHQEPLAPETTQNPSEDLDEPTVLVKDPETGETMAVSPNEIKNNPGLAKRVISNPSAQDYQSAGTQAPSDPRIYNCVKEIYESTGESRLVVDLGGGNGMIPPGLNPSQCKTIKDKVFPKPPGTPVLVPDPEPVYVSSSYMKDYAEFTGNCIGSGTNLAIGYGSSSKSLTAVVKMDSNNNITDDTRPSTSYNSSCDKWVLMSSTTPRWVDFGFGDDGNGNWVHLGGEYRQTFYYDLWRFTKESYDIQRRVAVCTVNGTAHYKEIEVGDPCDLYKQNHNGWSTNKL